MNPKTTLILFSSLILAVGYLTHVQAVTDAELEALEKQIEQQEAKDKKQTESKEERTAKEKQMTVVAPELTVKERLKRVELAKNRKQEICNKIVGIWSVEIDGRTPFTITIAPNGNLQSKWSVMKGSGRWECDTPSRRAFKLQYKLGAYEYSEKLTLSKDGSIMHGSGTKTNRFINTIYPTKVIYVRKL